MNDLRLRLRKLGIKLSDLYATTGSFPRAMYYLAKFCALRAARLAWAALATLRLRERRAEIVQRRDQAGEPPLIAIKLTGGLGDYILAARYLRDLAASVEPFRFDVYCTSPDMAQWIFESLPGLRAAYSEFIFDELKGTYPLALWITQFIVVYSEAAHWSAIRECRKLCSAIQNAIRFRPKIAPLIDAHPYMDGYLAQKAIYMNLSRQNFVHGMTKTPYGGDAFDIAVSHEALSRYGLQADHYLTIHNGFDPSFVITASTATKCYARFDEVVRHIKLKLPWLPVVQLGASNSQPIAGVDLDLIDKVTIQEAAGVLKQSRFHIDIESGLVHLASCFSVRSCVLFGPTPADYFGYAKNINLRPSECGGCWWINQTWMDQCPRQFSEPACMTAHDPDNVAATIIEALHSARPKLVAKA